MRRRLDDRRSDRLVLPLRVPVRRASPTTRRWASGPTRTTRPSTCSTRRHGFLGPEVCAYNRASMLTGARRRSSASRSSTAFGGLLPVDLDGAHAAARRLAELRGRLRRRTRSTSGSSTSTGRRPRTRRSPAPTTSRSRPSRRPAAAAPASRSRDDAAARLARRPADVPARVPQLRRPRVARRQPHGRPRAPSPASAGTSSATPSADADRVPAGHVSRPTRRYRWMGSIAHGQAGQHGARLQRVERVDRARHPLHRPARRRPARRRWPGRRRDHRRRRLADGRRSSRWGDYSEMSIDPVDDCTFWYTSEYLAANGTFNWRTRIGTFKLAGCGTPDFGIAATPAGQTVSPVAARPTTSTSHRRVGSTARCR